MFLNYRILALTILWAKSIMYYSKYTNSLQGDARSHSCMCKAGQRQLDSDGIRRSVDPHEHCQWSEKYILHPLVVAGGLPKASICLARGEMAIITQHHTFYHSLPLDGIVQQYCSVGLATQPRMSSCDLVGPVPLSMLSLVNKLTSARRVASTHPTFEKGDELVSISV